MNMVYCAIPTITVPKKKIFLVLPYLGLQSKKKKFPCCTQKHRYGTKISECRARPAMPTGRLRACKNKAKGKKPYNKLLTNRASSSRTGEYWPSVVFVRTSLRSVRTATTSGQYSPVRPSRSVSKKLLKILLLIIFLRFQIHPPPSSPASFFLAPMTFGLRAFPFSKGMK